MPKSAYKLATLVISILLVLVPFELILRVQTLIELDGWHGCPVADDKSHTLTVHSTVPQIPQKQVGSCGPGRSTARILFLGDSWMEHGGIADGVADYLTQNSTYDCVLTFNGGTSSFAPSLYLLSGLLLIRQFHPDFVFVNIDETDLMDETVRYREVTALDENGEIVGVFYKEPIAQIFRQGFCALERHRLYTLRLIEKTYHTRFFSPRLRSLYFQEDHSSNEYERLLAPQLSQQSRIEFAKEIDYFQVVLGQMSRRLSAVIGDRRRVILTHHPHFLGQRSIPKPERYQNVVEVSVRQVAQEHGNLFVEAGDSLAQIYGEDTKRFFRWPDDKFSHLTAEGYIRYGQFIARSSAAHLASLRHEERATLASPQDQRAAKPRTD